MVHETQMNLCFANEDSLKMHISVKIYFLGAEPSKWKTHLSNISKLWKTGRTEAQDR